MSADSPRDRLRVVALVVALMTVGAGVWGLYATWRGHASVAEQIEAHGGDFLPRTWEVDGCERERVADLLTTSPEELVQDEAIGVWGLGAPSPCTMLTDAWRKSVGLGAWFVASLLCGLASLGLVATPQRARAGTCFGVAAGSLALALAAGRSLAVLVVLTNRVLLAAFVLPLPDDMQAPSWWTLVRSEPVLLVSLVGVGASVLLTVVRGVVLARRARA